MRETVDLVGPVMLARDAEGRLSASVDGVDYVLVARRARWGEKSANADAGEKVSERLPPSSPDLRSPEASPELRDQFGASLDEEDR